MKRLITTLLPAVLLVAGCSGVGPRYFKPDVNEQKAKEEVDSCRADAQEATPEALKGVGGQERVQAEVVDQCMKAKGFSRASP